LDKSRVIPYLVIGHAFVSHDAEVDVRKKDTDADQIVLGGVWTSGGLSRQSPPDSLNSSSQKLLTFLQQLIF
jgi:hypothetical protein